jgi:hypothetical protein
MPSGIPGSTWQPRDATAHRLARWRRLADIGWPVDDIAAELGISRYALGQLVYRARKNGHPDAIRHPHAGAAPGEGLSDLVNNSSRRSRRLRRIKTLED